MWAFLMAIVLLIPDLFTGLFGAITGLFGGGIGLLLIPDLFMALFSGVTGLFGGGTG
jgi:hypothetical protein